MALDRPADAVRDKWKQISSSSFKVMKFKDFFSKNVNGTVFRPGSGRKLKPNDFVKSSLKYGEVRLVYGSIFFMLDIPPRVSLCVVRLLDKVPKQGCRLAEQLNKMFNLVSFFRYSLGGNVT